MQNIHETLGRLKGKVFRGRRATSSPTLDSIATIGQMAKKGDVQAQALLRSANDEIVNEQVTTQALSETLMASARSLDGQYPGTSQKIGDQVKIVSPTQIILRPSSGNPYTPTPFIYETADTIKLVTAFKPTPEDLTEANLEGYYSEYQVGLEITKVTASKENVTTRWFFEGDNVWVQAIDGEYDQIDLVNKPLGFGITLRDK